MLAMEVVESLSSLFSVIDNGYPLPSATSSINKEERAYFGISVVNVIISAFLIPLSSLSSLSSPILLQSKCSFLEQQNFEWNIQEYFIHLFFFSWLRWIFFYTFTSPTMYYKKRRSEEGDLLMGGNVYCKGNYASFLSLLHHGKNKSNLHKWFCKEMKEDTKRQTQIESKYEREKKAKKEKKKENKWS